MKFMICGYGNPDELPFLPVVEKLNVGIELQSYGLDGIQSPEKWQAKLANHREVVRRFSGRLAIHGPFIGLDYAFKDHLLRQALRERMDLTFGMIRELRPETLVLHTGYTEETQKFLLEDTWFKNTTNFWKTEIRKYAEIGVTVVMENLLEKNPDTLIRLIDAVDNPCFKACFDIGHAHIWSDVSPAEWIKQLGNRLFHVHLHDNHGKVDEHLPVGHGTIDFGSFFQALYQWNPEINVSLEVDAAKETAIENLRYVLYKYGDITSAQ